MNIASSNEPEQIVNYEQSPVLRLARLINKYAPRGKGAIPRVLGALFMGNRLVKIQTVRGAWLLFPDSSLDMAAHFINHGGKWNEPVIRACISCLDEGDTFFDVGANLGVVAIDVAKHFNGKVSCFAFEPQSRLCRALTLAAELNDFSTFKTCDIAVGEETGDMTLYSAAQAVHVSGAPREKGARCFTVKCLTLDDLIFKQLTPAPTVLKIDIEGGELSLFKGAERTIKTFAPTIVFESDENMKRWGYTRAETLAFLSSHVPYTYYLIREGHSPCVYDATIHANLRSGDIVATRLENFIERLDDLSISNASGINLHSWVASWGV